MRSERVVGGLIMHHPTDIRPGSYVTARVVMREVSDIRADAVE